MSYLYETHMHTCLASACGVSTGKEHVHFYKDQGFTGIIVTDHFFGGNTCVPRDLPWEKRIDLFFRGYEDALEEGLKVGLDVFFGLEQNYDHDEYLIYGLTKEYMKAHQPSPKNAASDSPLDDETSRTPRRDIPLSIQHTERD